MCLVYWYRIRYRVPCCCCLLPCCCCLLFPSIETVHSMSLWTVVTFSLISLLARFALCYNVEQGDQVNRWDSGFPS